MKKRALVLIPLSLLTLLLAILFSQQRITIRPVQAATGAASVFFSLSDQTLDSDGVNIAVGDLDGDDDIDALVARAGGKEVYYATVGQVALPIILSQPLIQTLAIHSRVDAPGRAQHRPLVCFVLASGWAVCWTLTPFSAPSTM